MGFSIGDKVAVIDDVLTGKVIAVTPQKITIETADGFPFEFTTSELVVVKENQQELSKYSDINNESLREKNNIDTPKKSAFKNQKTSKKDRLPPMEVDLHIHQLTSSSKGMDNYDMLNLQIETAKRKLEFAIRNKIPKVVFIHGIGEGVLKMELEFLFKNYPVSFYAASFRKYGMGATEVHIYQNA